MTTKRTTEENRKYYERLHKDAIISPSGFERPVLGILTALRQYAEQYHDRYLAPVGEDGYTGDAWLQIAKGLRELLSCETGRLDCGTIDGEIVEMVRAAGFEDSEL